MPRIRLYFVVAGSVTAVRRGVRVRERPRRSSAATWWKRDRMGSISIQNVTKQFGGQVVLDDVALELNSGETVGIVGPNGAGKTTIFRLVLDWIQPDLGTVTRSRGL